MVKSTINQNYDKVKGYTHTNAEIYTWVHGRKIFSMARESISSQMDRSMMDSSIMESWMGRASIFMIKDLHTMMALGGIILSMGMGFTIVSRNCTKDSGIMG